MNVVNVVKYKYKRKYTLNYYLLFVLIKHSHIS
jgi:hypothetical protein